MRKHSFLVDLEKCHFLVMKRKVLFDRCDSPMIKWFWNDVQAFGLMTKPLVRLLLPSSKHVMSLASPPSTPKSFTVPLLGSGREDSSWTNGGTPNGPPPTTTFRMLLSSIPTRGVHHYWRKFDDSVMRPVFGGRGFVPYVPGSPLEQSVHQWHAS